MSTIRTVIVPDRDNDGISLASEQTAFETYLLETVGGFTAENVRGAWRDSDGTVYRDASVRYTLALDETQDATLLAYLPTLCAACRQEALFTEAHQATVDFITARIPAEQTA